MFYFRQSENVVSQLVHLVNKDKILKFCKNLTCSKLTHVKQLLLSTSQKKLVHASVHYKYIHNINFKKINKLTKVMFSDESSKFVKI